MFQKGFTFYADWRTPDGQRHRKGFDSALKAKHYELEQKGQTANPTAPVPSPATARRLQAVPARLGTSPDGSGSSAKGSDSQSSGPGTSKPSKRGTPAKRAPRDTATPANSGNSSEGSRLAAERILSPVSPRSRHRNPASPVPQTPKPDEPSVAPILHSAGSSHAGSISGSGEARLSNSPLDTWNPVPSSLPPNGGELSICPSPLESQPSRNSLGRPRTTRI